MRYVILHPSDNVAVALATLARGERLEIAERGITITLTEEIPYTHKFSLTAIPTGAHVYKYGAPIGAAWRDIEAGAYVHLHNLRTLMAEPSASDEGWANRAADGR